MPSKTKEDTKPRSKKKKLIAFVVVVGLALIIAGATVLVVKYNNSQKEVKRLSNPSEAAKTETEIIVGRVGKLTDLPSNETPTLATVQDANKLKNQAFFANAQNGDKVLIYSSAKKAYLFRPSTNKIINIAPVNLGNQSQPATSP